MAGAQQSLQAVIGQVNSHNGFVYRHSLSSDPQLSMGLGAGGLVGPSSQMVSSSKEDSKKASKESKAAKGEGEKAGKVKKSKQKKKGAEKQSQMQDEEASRGGKLDGMGGTGS